ncbi:MAG TPA: hypothetical protein VK327_16445 [Candidatus Paceibacterota bacterium]|nr:hypothetical protein [Candidatus Paceibacterota bacterium]
MKRWWVKALVGITVLAVILVLSFLGSMVRSKSELERFKEKLRASGETLDWKAIVLPLPQAEENAAELFNSATPFLKDSFNDVLSTNPPMAMRMLAPGRAAVISQQADIQAYQTTYSWTELNEALARRAPVFELLEQIGDRKYLQLDLDYGKGPNLLLPHLSQMKRWSQLATAKTLADLHTDDGSSAATNQHNVLRLLAVWNREPLLITQLVRIAMYQIIYSGQWELLQSTNFSDADLAMLQSDWERVDLQSQMEAALVGERIFGIEAIEHYRMSNSPPDFSLMGGSSGGFTWSGSDWWDDLKENGAEVRRRIGHHLWRASWSLDDEMTLLKTDQVLIDALREVKTNGFYKEAVEKARKENEGTIEAYRRNHKFRAVMRDEMGEIFLTPEALAKSLDKLLVTEAARQLSISAIALKRFELKYGHLPERLDSLVPEFAKAVPYDPVDGKPLRYRLNADGSFLLYSIGENAIDDGGSAVSAKSSSTSFSWQRGLDWVWPQPATEAEVEAFRAAELSGK